MAWSNIWHKVAVRIQMLESLAKPFHELNKKRVLVAAVAGGSAATVFVAPFDGYVEEVFVGAGADSTSTSGNSLTVEIDSVSTGDTLFSFDTFANGVELVQDYAVEVDNVPGVSDGLPIPTFKKGELVSVTVTLNGSVSGFTSSSVLPLSIAFTPANKEACL